jgi:hypothetical protein
MTTEVKNLKTLLDSINPEVGKTLGDWDQALTCTLISQAQFNSKLVEFRKIASEYFIPPNPVLQTGPTISREYVDNTLAYLNIHEITYMETNLNLAFSKAGMPKFTVTIGVTSVVEFDSLLNTIK